MRVRRPPLRASARFSARIRSGSTLTAHSSRRQGGRCVESPFHEPTPARAARSVARSSPRWPSSSWPWASPPPSPRSRADPSDVVVALDFSSSILNDKPNRTQFANALDDIADRVEVIRDDLVNGERRHLARPVRQSSRRLPGVREPGAPRGSRGGQQARGLPPAGGQAVPPRPRRVHRQQGRDRHELREGDAAGRDLPACRFEASGHRVLHRRQARRPGHARLRRAPGGAATVR